jgi:hypothetical protein
LPDSLEEKAHDIEVDDEEKMEIDEEDLLSALS